MNRAERLQRLHELFETRIVCLDGGMGTAIQAQDLSAEDFGGEAFEGCNEHLVLSKPEAIESIHRGHLEAGADIIETDTFGSTSLVLSEYPPLDQKAHEITLAAAQLARRCADELATPERPRFVAGSMGPTTKAISVTGGVTFDALRETFAEQARAMIEGGVDYLLIETAQDTRNIKAALLGCDDAFQATGERIPIAVSGTIEPMGTMLAGQTADALAVSLMHRDLLYLGLNCATGPDFMTDHIRAISELAKTRVACVPNAGLPDEDGHYLETPEMIARVLERFCDEGWLNLVGGCCGTTPEHTRALAQMIEGKAPRRIPEYHRTLVSGLEAVEIAEDNRPVIVGERTNSLGSRRFKRLIAEEKYEEASEIARAQVRGGAQVIDVCLQNPDRDEMDDTARFLDQVIRKVKAPLMIDSTDHRVIELGLSYSQGKSIINSINLEDGLDRFEKVVPIARSMGAALIVGCIDDDRQQGMAVTRQRKLEVAKRSHDILVNDFGVDPSDIIFDPLVFPCATGDETYLGSALETVEGIRAIKEALPLCKTILGISNVSFGLPPAGREVLNSVFLYHCTQAGLDMAIVNSEKLERYASIPDEERRLAEQVLFETSDETVAAFTEKFRGKRRERKPAVELSLDERLANYIIEGTKEGLIADLEEKRKDTEPLNIINGPLMAGMDEVGRLFNRNELIVAEVLQSAEAMKAAVGHLEQYMEKAEGSGRGKVILATVKGDVHDIGKNLVEIILSNNGYQVVNLGIKVPPHELIEAIEEHRPDIIGLSGLLVKSAQQMVITAEELSAHDRCPPLLVGGAALTRPFTRKRIAPAYKGMAIYARDAMDGLELAAQIQDPARREELGRKLAEETEKLLERDTAKRVAEAPPEAPRTSNVHPVEKPPAPPDYQRHVMQRLPLDEVWACINPKMLLGKHLGVKGDPEKLLAKGDEKARTAQAVIDELKAELRPGAAEPMQARALWQFFRASRQGDTLRIYDADEPARVITELPFPRQQRAPYLCLPDYVREPDANGLPQDSVCLFVTTAGEGIRERYQRYKDEGEFLKSHAIQALAIETAEGAAEWLHQKLRGQWGIPDLPGTTPRELFQTRYRGKRYSFGYPACPDLALQRPFFALLHPEDIGVILTDEDMMDPEASVSALVLHHPDCKYFAV